MNLTLPELIMGEVLPVTNYYEKKDSLGFVSLVVVLILGVIGATAAVLLLTNSTTSTTSVISVQNSYISKSSADSCAEQALEQIRQSTSFSGSGNLTLGGVSCTYNVVIGSGENRTITAESQNNDTFRKVSVTITQINPNITVSSWQEVQ